MFKLLPLMLSAAVLVAPLFQASGAPLAKKDAQRVAHSRAITEMAKPAPKVTGAMTLLRKGTTSGIQRVESKVSQMNAKALKHATKGYRAVAEGTDLRGMVTFSNAWSEDAPEYGMYKIPFSEGGTFSKIGAVESAYTFGYDNGDGKFYGFKREVIFIWEFYSIDVLDSETWELLSSTTVDDASLMGYDCAVDPATGLVYACLMNEDGTFEWATVDLASASRTDISVLEVALTGIGCTKDGQFYGYGIDGSLYKVDKATGALTQIGEPSALPQQYLTGGCVNDKGNTFLMAYCNDATSGLAEIDLATGAATIVKEFADGEEVNAMYIPAPAAEEKAPAAPGFQVVCPDGAQKVELTVTLPTTLFDGSECTDQTLGFEIYADGQKVAEGEAAPGASASKTLDIEKSGEVNFFAIAKNAVGNSPKTKVTVYVGKGAPKAPANVALTWADGKATITWDAVTESADGGYFDPAAVTYTVADLAGTVVAEGLTATSFTTDVPEPDSSFLMLGYQVKAVYAEKVSEAGVSNTVGLGAFCPPTTFDLSTVDVFNYHTVADINGDNSTWQFYTDRAIYRYNTSNNGDDWLFSPNVKLEAGKAYAFTASVKCSSTFYPERLEVKVGDATTPEAMTIEVVPVTDVVWTDPQDVTGTITVPVTGIYHIGFHAVSDADMNQLALYSYSIGQGAKVTSPTSPEDIVVTPAASGDLEATIEFKTATKSLNGEALTGELTTNVLRNGEMLKTVKGKPGMLFSFVDKTVPEIGYYTYTFETLNAEGDAGLPTSVTVFIGPKAPAVPANVKLVETADGQVTLTWDAVTTDVDGTVLPAGNVTYNVFLGDTSTGSLTFGEQLNDQPLTETSFVYNFEVPADQDFLYLIVQASNRDVVGQARPASTIVGIPYDMPVLYTGASSLEQYFLSYGGSGQLQLGSAEMGVEAYDGDDSYYAVKGSGYGPTFMQTGKIKLSELNPMVKFYIYGIINEEGTVDQNQTIVSVVCDGVETELKTINHSELVADEWNEQKISLTDFKGKVVTLKFTTVTNTYTYTLWDAVDIREDLSYDLTASVTAPAAVAADEEFNVEVTVKNVGREDAENFKVTLYRDEDVVETVDFTILGADETEQLLIPQTITLKDTQAAYHAVVTFDADEDPTNNTTDKVVVKRNISTLPGVTGLTGEATESGNVLTWNAIDLSQPHPAAVTEDFESGDSFADEFEGWEFVDVDGGANGGFQNLEIPNHPVQSAYSFFLFDASADGFNATFAAHSGTKYLATMFNYQDQQIDDWAISPLLPGVEQTVSFWARSYSADYPETLEVWYTTEDSVDPESFENIDGWEKLPATWTKYEFDLPAEAKRFAIRSCAAGSFMLMVDDITYTSMVDLSSLEVKGYNVYCDGVKVNESPVADPSYVHVAEAGQHTYNVTAVYANGESEFSEPLSLETSGLTLNKAGQLKVYAKDGEIVVSGAADSAVTISTADGRVLYHAAGDARVAVTPAVYLVTVGKNTYKLLAR